MYIGIKASLDEGVVANMQGGKFLTGKISDSIPQLIVPSGDNTNLISDRGMFTR